jgi:thioredoxin-like negative regulator of GroEL
MIDGDEAADLVATLGVRGFPTFIGVHRGEIVARQAGFGGKRGLEALVQQLLEP